MRSSGKPVKSEDGSAIPELMRLAAPFVQSAVLRIDNKNTALHLSPLRPITPNYPLLVSINLSCWRDRRPVLHFEGVVLLHLRTACGELPRFQFT